jgi:hypothetical protein
VSAWVLADGLKFLLHALEKFWLYVVHDQIR